MHWLIKKTKQQLRIDCKVQKKSIIKTPSCFLLGLQIIHPLLQTGTESPCEKMDCSHMCVLAPGPKAVCKCPFGLLLAEDGLTCSSLVNSAFLLMLSPSTVTQVLL